jgi:hypothetical protein
VGTSTTAFVGATQRGPLLDPDRGDLPELLTSFSDYERIFGGAEDLMLDDAQTTNCLAHAVRAYFENGGGRLYVVRVYAGDVAEGLAATDAAFKDGDDNEAKFVARMPGAAFAGTRVRLRLQLSPIGDMGLRFAPDGTVVRTSKKEGEDTVYSLWVREQGAWKKYKAEDGAAVDPEAAETPSGAALLTASVELVGTDPASGEPVSVAQFDGLSFGAGHPRSITRILAKDPERRADALANPIYLDLEEDFEYQPAEALASITAEKLPEILAQLDAGGGADAIDFPMKGGKDGGAPKKDDYVKALRVVRSLQDVSIVAAPGYSALGDDDRESVQAALIAHAEEARAYRIAVLDAPFATTPSRMRQERGKVDSKFAALYYPGVVIANPLAGPKSPAPAELTLPPSGFVCGIYARNDVQRGVHKAPANEIVRGALRFEREVNFGEQQLLNPIGVNCLRYLSGRGYRVWGARTVSSDPEWIYVNVRRYFNYLGASIDRGTQWAVFEPNGEQLWANVRSTVSDFLYNEWRNGALLGSKPEEAFFVRCDRTTMTQNDLDFGRLVCLIGVAVVKPAEFVIFRIGQKTADAK